MDKLRMVLASNNAGKIRELNALLSRVHIDLVSQAELGVSDIAETAHTFVENALIKARHAARITGLPALADDSGLCVTALDGAPGIFSARYAGAKADAQENINKLLADMRAVPPAQRDAFFYCVLVFLAHEHDPTPLICEGKWSGNILSAPQGQQGFGYDPVFYVPMEKKSAAELPPEQKNKISHRGIALQSLLKLLPEKMHECALRTQAN